MVEKEAGGRRHHTDSRLLVRLLEVLVVWCGVVVVVVPVLVVAGLVVGVVVEVWLQVSNIRHQHHHQIR